jgi:hypothetical protein
MEHCAIKYSPPLASGPSSAQALALAVQELLFESVTLVVPDGATSVEASKMMV